MSDSAIVIAFSPYYNGAAPIRIENSCIDERVTVEFWQKYYVHFVDRMQLFR